MEQSRELAKLVRSFVRSFRQGMKLKLEGVSEACMKHGKYGGMIATGSTIKSETGLRAPSASRVELG